MGEIRKRSFYFCETCRAYMVDKLIELASNLGEYPCPVEELLGDFVGAKSRYQPNPPSSDEVECSV